MKKSQNRRIFVVFTLIVGIFSLLTVNVFVVSLGAYHLNSNTNFRQYVNNIYTRKDPIIAKRGSIFDINNNILAEDSTAYTLHANIDKERFDSKGKPAHVVDKEGAAKVISEVINAPYEKILAALEKEDVKQVEFGNYGKYLSPKQKEALETFEIPGLGFSKITKRDYVSESLAPTLIGATRFNDVDNKTEGIQGIEKYYQSSLEGKNGVSVYRQSQDLHRYDSIDHLSEEAVNGKDVQLTIDRIIQESFDNNLRSFLTNPKIEAEEAWGAIVEVKTGRIVALSDAPSFDKNDPNTSYINRALEYEYEPGSTMKTLTMAMAFNEGVVKEEELFDGKPFYIKIDKNGKMTRVQPNQPYTEVINNPNKQIFPMMTYALGYQRSSNVMIADIMVNRLDLDKYRQYIHDLGFFKPVGIDNNIPEASGRELWSTPFEKVTNGFGQGSMVTMMQIIQAHTAIFGDGTVIKPYLVESITNPNTNEVEFQATTQRLKKVFDEDAVKRVRYLMYENTNLLPYSNSRYKMDEVNVMSKTGTAEYVIDGKYSKDKYISSVVQGFPYEDPQYILYYAYKAKAGHSAREAASVMKNTIRTMLTTYPTIIDNGNSNEKPVQSFELKNYINMNVLDVNEELKSQGRDALIFGDGDIIINQYPKEGIKLLSNEKLMFMTSSSNLKVPDMKGWSAKEVNAFSQFTKMQINISGSGFVDKQSLPPDEIITKDTKIDVIMK